MHLKSVTLKGFKSFAQPTTSPSRPGVTCIVGPNGSGKSNVVDALAWVMGEQGAKTLRGGKMEDVIFAGTATRGPLGRAEVQLTIDNSDGALPIEYAEVTHQPHAVPQRRERVRDQRRRLPAARRAGAAERLRPRPRDARDRRPGPPRQRAAGLARGAPRLHRGGRRHPEAPPAQGEDPSQARRDGGQPHAAERPRRRAAPAAASRSDARPRSRARRRRSPRSSAMRRPDCSPTSSSACARELAGHARSEQERHTERLVLQDQLDSTRARIERLEAQQRSEAVDEARRVAFGLERVQERLRGLYTLAGQRLALLGEAAGRRPHPGHDRLAGDDRRGPRRDRRDRRRAGRAQDAAAEASRDVDAARAPSSTPSTPTSPRRARSSRSTTCGSRRCAGRPRPRHPLSPPCAAASSASSAPSMRRSRAAPRPRQTLGGRRSRPRARGIGGRVRGGLRTGAARRDRRRGARSARCASGSTPPSARSRR